MDTTYKNQYKNKKLGFQDLNEGRTLRSLQHKQNRKSNRFDTYNERRQISPVKTDSRPKSPKESRLTKLLKWKSEKEKKKAIEKQLKVKSKPLFKIFHVNEDIFKDVTTFVNNAKQKKNACYDYVQSKINTGRVTRSTTAKKKIKPCVEINKHNFAPPQYDFKVPENIKPLKSKKEINESICRITRSQAKKNTSNILFNGIFESTQIERPILKNRQSKASEINLEIENTFPINNIELRDSNFFMTEPTIAFGSSMGKKQKENEIISSPLYNMIKNDSLPLSPFVTVVRGKKNARRESKLRQSYGHVYQQNQILNEDEHIELLKEKKKAEDFECTLNNEIKRLLAVCEQWNTIMKSNDFSNNQNIKDEIDSVIGQTRLLINKKFEQFRKLIHSSIEGNGEKPIHSSDLQGFWEMMYIQVDNLNMRFKKLDEMKTNNWTEQAIEDQSIKKYVGLPKKNIKKIGPTSGIKAMLQEARKKMVKKTESDVFSVSNDLMNKKNNETNNFSIDNQNVNITNLNNVTPKALKYDRLIEVMSSKPRTSHYKSSPGLMMLKVSNIAKSIDRNIIPDTICDTSINYPNMYQTPTKSILKTPKTGGKSSKSILKSVLFEKNTSTENLDNTNKTTVCINEDLISWETPKKTMEILNTNKTLGDIDEDAVFQETPKKKERRRSSRLIMKQENLI